MKLAVAVIALSGTQYATAFKKSGQHLKKNVLRNGMQVVSGEDREIEEFRSDLDRRLGDIDRMHPDHDESVDEINNKYSNLKQMIQKQMVNDVMRNIHPLTMGGQPWNMTVGMPPLRGSYNSIQLSTELEQLGLKKSSDGKEILPKSHYCKYRAPSEVDNDRYSCCVGENTECYTTAGCFCDESCYTKYGDCCTDHFLTCYQHLKLCLIKVDNSGATSTEATKEGRVTPKTVENYEKAQTELPATLDGWANRGADLGRKASPRPEHLEPNACCLQVPYHTGEENGAGQTRKCCSGVLTYNFCPAATEEEGF